MMNLSNATITQAVAKRTAWMQARLHELVAAQSFSGHEQAAQTLMERWLREMQFSVTRVPVDAPALARHAKLGWLASPAVPALTGCDNVFGTRQPATVTGKSLLISGHVDVVPTGPVALVATPLCPLRKRGLVLRARRSGHERWPDCRAHRDCRAR
jgi:acetylornithine deacetylase